MPPRQAEEGEAAEEDECQSSSDNARPLPIIALHHFTQMNSTEMHWTGVNLYLCKGLKLKLNSESSLQQLPMH